MKYALLLLLLLLLSTGDASPAPPTIYNSALLLKYQCEQQSPVDCMQYILGVVDGANLERKYFCPPPRMVPAQLPMMYARFAHEHPEYLNETRLTVVLLALRESMPCGAPA